MSREVLIVISIVAVALNSKKIRKLLRDIVECESDSDGERKPKRSKKKSCDDSD
jgi:hypothetical protein